MVINISYLLWKILHKQSISSPFAVSLLNFGSPRAVSLSSFKFYFGSISLDGVNIVYYNLKHEKEI